MSDRFEAQDDTRPDIRAPVFTTAWDLCVWLLQKFDAKSSAALALELCTLAMRLLDEVTNAIKGIDRSLALHEADTTLQRLRLRIRLANATGQLTEAQCLHALTLCDKIGRQIGGWQRALDRAQ